MHARPVGAVCTRTQGLETCRDLEKLPMAACKLCLLHWHLVQLSNPSRLGFWKTS